MIERTILFWITHWGGGIYALLLYIWNIRLIGFPVLVLVKRTTIRARNRTIILNIAFAYRDNISDLDTFTVNLKLGKGF